MKLAGNMKDAGKLCGVSRWTVQKWVREGLPFKSEGRKHKTIVFSTLEEWLKSRQVTVKGAI